MKNAEIAWYDSSFMLNFEKKHQMEEQIPEIKPDAGLGRAIDEALFKHAIEMFKQRKESAE